MVLIKNGIVYRNAERELRPMDILCDNGVIVDMSGSGGLKAEGAEVIDAEGAFLLPGLIDVHTHGREGYDFNELDADLSVVAAGYARHGVTTVMPTLASAPLDEMVTAAENIDRFVSGRDQASFCGVHIEGRYLNAKKRGAHAENMLAALEADELDRFLDISRLHISAAYELDKGGEFSKKALCMNATLALAHTAATYAEAKAAEERGVSAYTHLFNAMPPLHHRDGGAVAACLTGMAYGELICDGIHIAPEVVRLAYSCKRDRLTLISDSMQATGCCDGEYFIGGNPVTVKDGRAVTHDGALAGSTLTLDEAVRNLMVFCDIPLTEAILCATEAPAREVDIFSECGSLDVGKRADMLFAAPDTKRLEIKKIMLRGNMI